MTVTRNHVSVSNKICSKFHSLRISAARYCCVPEGGAGPDFGWFGGVCERLQVS